MTRVSKDKPQKKVSSKINDKFFETIVNLKDKENGKPFLENMLTSAEKTMLAKRLAMIIMMDNDAPFSVIKTTLKVSPSTVGRMYKRFKQGKYDHIISVIDKVESREDVIAQIESIMNLGGYIKGRHDVWFYKIPKNNRKRKGRGVKWPN